MATASASGTKSTSFTDDRSVHLKLLLPYGIAILAQLPMLFLYFKGLWGRPHYQFFPFAILAVAGMAWVRWPRHLSQPFLKSRTSDLLMALGLAFALFALLFIEPWFSAISATLIVTSLFARTYDFENERNLWPVALPLFVCLLLPGNLDSMIITRMQAASAHFTSMILDLLGQGHNLDGIKITLASGKPYDIEQGCSGVVSFFTLVAITVAFVVWARRVYPLKFTVALALIAIGFGLILLDLATTKDLRYLAMAGVGCIFVGLLGFRAGLLMMSTVFWALLMNTVRILLIPLADVHLNGLDLSKGVAHDLLGYTALIFGILLVLSTDQLLTFLFGPVDDLSQDASGLQRPITRFWNSILAGKEETSSTTQRKSVRNSLIPLTESGRKSIWIAAAIIGLMGLIQLWGVKQAWSKPDLEVRFFDSDVTVDFQEADLPKLLENWEMVKYQSEGRETGSDLGARSDQWLYQGTKSSSVAIVSLDQTFPGWHELTTCYKNQGWTLESRVVHADEKSKGWPFVEAHLTRKTGEHGYLLFSLFDAQGQSVDPPVTWNSLNSLLIRVRNRLSNRIRATLFDSHAYQTQAFLTSFRPLEEDVMLETVDRYLQARELMRQKFIERRGGASTEPTNSTNSTTSQNSSTEAAK